MIKRMYVFVPILERECVSVPRYMRERKCLSIQISVREKIIV